MYSWLLDYIVCPQSHQPLQLSDATYEGKEIVGGNLIAPDGRAYPIVNGVPRFVEQHYATAFGFQWNRHRTTQIDSKDHNHSAERFWGETGFGPKSLQGRLVFDGGCGAGRFTDIAASVGARVVAVDLSDAVDACRENNRQRENVAVVQASLFNLPFCSLTFDAVFTIGVIQHTPDPLEALHNVGNLAKVGGQAGLSWYKKKWYTYLHQKYILRRTVFDGWEDKELYDFVSWYVPKLLPVSRLLRRVTPQSILNRILPVANRDGVPGLTMTEKLEWAILDTYDWYNPKYDLPQTLEDVERTMRKLGYKCEPSPHSQAGLHCIRVSESSDQF